MLTSVATHGLRDRIRRTRQDRALLQARLRELTVMDDRERIAANLKDHIIQRIFAVGLNLHSTAALTAEPEVRRRVGAAVDDLDQAVRTLRDTIFGLEHRLHDRRLRKEILKICGDSGTRDQLQRAS